MILIETAAGCGNRDLESRILVRTNKELILAISNAVLAINKGSGDSGTVIMMLLDGSVKKIDGSESKSKISQKGVNAEGAVWSQPKE